MAIPSVNNTPPNVRLLAGPSVIPNIQGYVNNSNILVAPDDIINGGTPPNQLTGGVVNPTILPITVLPGSAPGETPVSTGFNIAGVDLSWPVMIGLAVIVFIIYQAKTK